MKLSTILWLACGCAATLAHAECPLDVQATPTRADWHAGEPIEVNVRIANRADRPAALALAYPSLGGQGHPGIGFSLRPNAPLTASTNAIESVLQIAPRAALDVHVYANKYLPALPPGASRVYWQLEIACLDGKGAFLAPGKFAGAFTVRIAAGALPDAPAVVARYAQRLDASDPQQRREAIEALSNMPDPAVLPALGKVYQYGYRNDALQALRKFDGHPAAASMLVEILATADAGAARNALRIATGWKTPLPPELLEQVAGGTSLPARLALVDYLAARRSAANDALLQRLAADDDETLAKSARAALAKPAPTR
ncbi:HEAT repeat domain-containing protein [Pseudoduganella armeniaca]|uniref:HEAT repeat domain-containing protein n=1 Tax=Pseudoduganella armeniaca TaxID=2072590 RepID=A0A2R4CCX3_9BURK|nr:HEAT repeat domain-containing protein [Pseudoduganella armeniaca]AVR97494.1 hypothetical protein C9I28_18970 [Pseudoduganella armeniaca]